MILKCIYFLVVLLGVAATVFEHVQAQTQLRLVDGLLIIEGSHPLLLESSGSRNGSRSGSSGISSSIRNGLRESHDHEFHGHGYLNRNRAASGGSSSSSGAKEGRKAYRNNFIRRVAPPVFDEATSQVVNIKSEETKKDKEIQVTSQKKEIERKSEREVKVTETEKNPDPAEEKDKTTDNNNQNNDGKNLNPDNESTDKENNNNSGQNQTPMGSVPSPTMDVITIIWYFSTFIALVAFFVVMVCSDKYCTRASAKPEEAVISAPATPAPSYREFAPPSYDSVMRKQKSRIFMIPMLNECGELKSPEATVEAINTSQLSSVAVVEAQNLGAVSSPRRDLEGSTEKSLATGSGGGGGIAVVVVVNERLEKSSISEINESR